MARALGITDAVTACECCGKSPLVKTVIMELDDGTVVHYGTTCAARNTGKSQKEITSEIRAAAERALSAAQKEYRASAEYLAECAKFAERDRFPHTDARRLGMAAAEFVREARAAAQAKAQEIATRHGVSWLSL